MADRRRAVVTGVGVIAPCGIGAKAFWEGLQAEPNDGIRAVEGFLPSMALDNPKAARRTDRFALFALAAAAEAIDQAGDVTPHYEPCRIGVAIGTGVGGLATTEENVLVHDRKGPRRVSPFLVPMMMPNAAAANVSMEYGLQGPCEAVVTACAAGTHSLGAALDTIRADQADAMLAGGSEAALTPTGIQGFENMTALSRRGRSEPFSPTRDGFVIAEGAAVLVIEERERALARGATPIAELMGAANGSDAHHITAPSPGGAGAARCMRTAIADAGLAPGDIGQINAHGTSTALNDQSEAEAIEQVFGLPGPAVTATKAVTGHPLGAAGAIEAAACVLSIQHGEIPPTMVTESLDPELPALDLVRATPRPWEPAPILSNSFGFGGHNGCLVLGPS